MIDSDIEGQLQGHLKVNGGYIKACLGHLRSIVVKSAKKSEKRHHVLLNEVTEDIFHP